MRLLALALALLPAAAHAAETLTVTADGSTTGPVRVGGANCGTRTISFSWSASTSATSYTLIAARNASACSTQTVTSPDVVLGTTSQTSFSVSASQLLIEAASDGGSAGTTCATLNHGSAAPLATVFCVQTATSTALGTTVEFGHFDINFANQPPTPPTSLSATPGSQHLRIGWAPGSSAEKIDGYDVHVVQTGQPLGATAAVHVSATTTADAQHTDDGAPLVDDTQAYDIAVVATDVFGNVSSPSARISATPTYVADFYNHYRDDGGAAAGGHGCATGADAAWLAALIAAGAFAARRRRSGAALVVLFALGAASAARAGSTYERPPRRLLVGLKIDRYHPGVDNEPGLTGTPYQDVFGDRVPLRYQVEVDWQVAHPFGALLLGVTAGYWQNIGKGILRSGAPSDDTALFDVIPFGVVGTYRFDWLADRYRFFPFIPYAQAGLTRALWASFSGTGAVSRRDTADGGRGSGWTYGYTTAVGVALNLDAIDPALAREAYSDVGLQRTSFFAEYGWTRLDNFHRSPALRLSDRGLRLGLSVEF